MISTAISTTGRLVYEFVHADTCLPDYWCGHHLPHLQIPVYRGMTMKAIKDALSYELHTGYVGGTCEAARLLNPDSVNPGEEDQAERIHKAAQAAINRIAPANKGQRRFFMELEPETDEDEFDESVYAYFVLRDLNQ